VCVFTLFFCISFFLFGTETKFKRWNTYRHYVDTSVKIMYTTPYSTLTSKVLCKKGVKGVDKPIFWDFREKSQTHHKLTGIFCICVMYVSRGFYNTSLDQHN
jgi:hypothetical protein